MPTRNVVLTERQEELIETLVKSGRYQNASEVLRDGLRLVEQREAVDAVKLKALRAAARVGVGASDRDEKIQHFRGAASLFEMRFRRRSSQEQPNRAPYGRAEMAHPARRRRRTRLCEYSQMDH